MMSVVLRSNSDLVYLPDHGFVGIDGAHRILLQITSQIRRLDLSHNLLGSEGTLQLIRGLLFCRARFSSPDLMTDSLWGLIEINLANNGVGDEAMAELMVYAKKDVFLEKVFLQGNDLEFRDGIETIINSLNSSRIQILSLTDNGCLFPSSVARLFRSLHAPHLTQLNLSKCNLGPALCRSIAEYLSSSRSSNLEDLQLNGNCFGAVGVRYIIDAIENHNFTIKQVGLLANSPLPPPGSDIFCGTGPTIEDTEAEEEALSFQVHQRLPLILQRNQILTRRTRAAARRVLGQARVLLNARRPAVGESAPGDAPPKFRLLDLPPELLQHVVRHCSGDPWALSAAQFARMTAEAADRRKMRRLRVMVTGRLDRAGSDSEEKEKVIADVIEDWLRKGGWEKWESEKMVEEPELEAGIEPEPDRKDDEDESLQPSRRGSYVSRLQSRRSSIQSPVLQAEAIQAYAADVWAAAV